MSTESAAAPTVALTGATGFIGRSALQALCKAGSQVVTIGRTSPGVAAITHIGCDLERAAPPTEAIRRSGADVLVHLAWNVEHDRYWTSETNEAWVTASLRLVDAFVAAGGTHVVVAGTCAEGSADLRASAYAQSKLRLHDRLAERTDMSLAWLRLFFPTGAHEDSRRLIPSLVRAGIEGSSYHVRNPDLVRDFFDVSDAGRSLAASAITRAPGTFEIGSGVGTSIRHITRLVAGQVGGLDNLSFGEASPTEPLVADTRAAADQMGWRPVVSLEQSIADSARWWAAQRPGDEPNLATSTASPTRRQENLQ